MFIQQADTVRKCQEDAHIKRDPFAFCLEKAEKKQFKKENIIQDRKYNTHTTRLYNMHPTRNLYNTENKT